MKIPIRKIPQTPANKPETNIPATRKNHSSPAKIKGMARTGAGHTAQTRNNPTHAKPRRKIDAAVIAQMAKAVATMLTETEAARLCGLEPRHWFEWKSRAGRAGKFSALLEEFRANKISGLLERVQKSADGVDVKFPDFRAALALLKFQDQKRFGDSPAVPTNPTPVIQISIIHEQLKKVIGFDDIKKLPSSANVGEPLPSPEQKGGGHHEK